MLNSDLKHNPDFLLPGSGQAIMFYWFTGRAGHGGRTAHFSKGFRYICKNTLIMNALRQYTTSEDGTIQLTVPAEYMHRRLEIIILPVDDASRPTPESAEQLREAHRIIDEGGGIEDPDTFLAEFERSRQDRSMPLKYSPKVGQMRRTAMTLKLIGICTIQTRNKLEIFGIPRQQSEVMH